MLPRQGGPLTGFLHAIIAMEARQGMDPYMEGSTAYLTRVFTEVRGFNLGLQRHG